LSKDREGEVRLVHCATYDSFDDLPDLMDKYGVVFCMIDALPKEKRDEIISHIFSEV